MEGRFIIKHKKICMNPTHRYKCFDDCPTQYAHFYGGFKIEG